MINNNARAAYMDASVATADPTSLLIMLCDRLVLDAQRAVAALAARSLQEAHNQLVHAQAIVMELRASLDPTGFQGGEQLAAIYDHLHEQLVVANMTKDVDVARQCLALVIQVSETWHQAAIAYGKTA